MRSDRVLGTIDFHTAGIGMRLLTTGLSPSVASAICRARAHRGRGAATRAIRAALDDTDFVVQPQTRAGRNSRVFRKNNA